MKKPAKLSFLVLSLASFALAQPALSDSLALLVTNTAYANAGVGGGPAQDHTVLLNAYRAQGFDVIDGRDMTAGDLRAAIEKFYARAANTDRLIVHFTGRAATLGPQSWLLPVDVQTGSPVAMGYDAPSVQMILRLLAAEPGHSALFFADIGGDVAAPFSAGIGDVNVPQGVLFVSGPEKTLNDFVVSDLLTNARPVAQALENADIALRIEGFVSPDVALVPAPATPPTAAGSNWIDLVAEQTLWAVADKSGKATDLQEYLTRFPNGIFADTAKSRLAALAKPAAPTAEDIENALKLSRADRRELQANLTVLGYDTRGVDGILGRGSRAAIAAWQQDQGLEKTAHVTAAQVASLSAQADARRAVIRRNDIRYWNATGLSGNKADLQRYLDKYPEGIHAAEAKDALAAIAAAEQEAADTAAWTTAVGENTADGYRTYLAGFPDGIYAEVAKTRIEALDPGSLTPDARALARAAERRLGLNPATRLLIETRLRSLGFNPGNVDGVFDSATRDAIRAYQDSKGMPVTGFVDSATVRALLLG